MSITLSTTIGTVTLKEEFDAYQAGIDLDGPYILKKYLAAQWSHVFPAINALRGTVSVVGGAGGAVTRSIPHQCPESTNLYCMSAVCDPIAPIDAKDAGRPTYRLPIITCRYGIPKYEIQTSDDPAGNSSFPNESTPGNPYTFAMMSIAFSSETIPIPNAAFKFTGPDLRTNVNLFRTVATAEMVFVRKYVPFLPFTNIATYIGKLNRGTFLGQGDGQIKLLGLQTKREYLSDGTRANEVELRFLWREYDHNMFLRDDTAVFDFLKDSGGNYIYKYIDMKPLLGTLIP